MLRAALAITLVAGVAFLTNAYLFPQQPASSSSQTIRADVDLVSISFAVRDGRGRLIPKLEKNDFRVFEDGREQPIKFFAHHTDVPLNIGVLLDTSTSITPLLETEANAASYFLRSVMRPADQGFAVSYNARVEILQLSTDDVDLLAKKTNTILRYGKYDRAPAPFTPPVIFRGPQTSRWPIPGQTGPDPDLRIAKLYDAVLLSVDRFLAREVGRKAMLILALADDAKSEASLEQALRALKRSETIAYVVEVEHAPRARRDDCDILHVFHDDMKLRIGRLAEETGGRVIRVKGFDKLQKAFEEIAEELHNQYSLGYTPPNPKWDGAFHRIEIRARPRDYRVYARDGYYAVR